MESEEFITPKVANVLGQTLISSQEQQDLQFQQPPMPPVRFPPSSQDNDQSGYPGSTTISTIVLKSGPIQLVVGLLQSGDIFHVKVVEITPQLTFIGANIDEAVNLQKEHDAVLKKLQDKNTPIDEFVVKAEKLLMERKAKPELLDAMGQSLSLAWNDVLKLLQQRKQVLDLNSNFHEKIGACRGKMSALEMACRDTMIPIETESVHEFLSKFKQLRIEVLASVMSALKEGNELLAKLREISHVGTLDSRPEHIQIEVKKSMTQVESWLEDLHDRRNSLELAWQTRKQQLEQCLTLTIFARDLNELENILFNRKNALSEKPFNLGDSEEIVNELLKEYLELKQDAVSLRDKALKITRATEKLVSNGCFAGDEASAKAYGVLNGCNEYLDLIDYREHLLHDAKEFFNKSEKLLTILEQLEIEVTTSKLPRGSREAVAIHCKILKDIVGLSEEPLRLGYALLESVGRSTPEVAGIKRIVEEIENRKIYLEEICSSYGEQHLQVSESLNTFLEKYNQILSWLVSIAEAFLRTNNSMGTTLPQSKEFHHLHHQLLADLEVKGNEINTLLRNVTDILESLDEEQRKDVDGKSESLRKHWVELKNIVEARVDLITMYSQFLQLAESLSNMFDYIEKVLVNVPEEEKLKQLEALWQKVKPAYEQLKSEGARFIDETSKVADPYLKTKSACSYVEEILSKFSSRQFNITESWENWTTTIVEKRETEILWERIMTENVQTMNAASKLDAQLYPVIINPSEDPNELKIFLSDKLKRVLCEIEKAHFELQDRIDITAAIPSKDVETGDKIAQVIQNLRAIKTKLETISIEYKILLENIIEFLDSIIDLKDDIERYFVDQKQFATINKENVDSLIVNHEQFRDNIMSKFKTLIKQSEQLIDRIRVQEPQGAKEHDTDRIISLLEKLRIIFESQNDTKTNELKKQNEIIRFNRELIEISKNIDDLERQLNDIQKQYGESSGSAKAAAIAFEYVNKTIQLLEKRIENFINTSENICKTYPDTEPFIYDELDKLKKKWDDFNEYRKNIHQMINLSIDYFTLYDKIETKYREHNSYLLSTTNQLPFIRTCNEANELINRIDNYITQNEGPQLNDLQTIGKLSNDIYGKDKTVQLYSDNIQLFQTFFKIKSDLKLLCERLKTDQDAAEKDQQRLHNEMITNMETITTTTSTTTTENIEKHEQFMKLQNETRIQEQQQQKRIEKEFHKPIFIQPLSDAIIQEGDKFTFECCVMGYPEPQIEWFKDGMSIQNNSDYLTINNKSSGVCTLSIEETFTEDSAYFTCKAINSVGETETTAKLSVKESAVDQNMIAPHFIRMLENGMAREGTSFEFHCIIGGNPLPTVQWYKNDGCVDNSLDYIISYNNGEAILRFEEVFLEDQAVFTCKASNPAGHAQCSASLSVDPLEPTEMPRFKIPLSNVMARVGQKIKLECEVTGIPRPELHWTHNGRLFGGRDAKLQYDNERVTFIISEAYPKDAGVYIVTAKNLAGEAYSSCNVSVKGRLPNETSDSELASDMEPVKPSVQLPLKDICVFEGKSVRLDCVIVGQPEPEVIWYHNGRPVKESADVQLLFQGDRCSLVIQEAYLDDIGEYKVVAINSAGEASSKCTLNIQPLNVMSEPIIRPTQSTIETTIQKTIQMEETNQQMGLPPKFERLLTDILADEGDKIEFICCVSGEPKPIIKWYLNNKEICETERIKFHQDTNNTNIVKLIIENCSIDDKGVYTVKASNTLGDAKCFSHLIVKSVNAPPPPPIDLTLQSSQQQRPQQFNEIEEKFICPSFKELFSDKFVQHEDTVKFECIVIGKPTPRIKWFFNDEPIHGKHFLISTSGDRQVLTIPLVSSETIGKIACVAENEIGKATCLAYLNVTDSVNNNNTEIITPSEQSQRYIEEHNTGSSNITIKKQLFTTTHTSQVNSIENGFHPQTQIHSFSKSNSTMKQINNDQQPEIIESKQYQEYKETNQLPPVIVQQKSIVSFQHPHVNGSDGIIPQLPKPIRKNIAPRFICPLIGKIVDQGNDVHLEAIVDGYPLPEITLFKNEEPLQITDNMQVIIDLNKVNINLKQITIDDAGRYSCTATNSAGSSTSTADIVVKKSIFPPVFGHRLQAQVVKKGERVLLDVEVSGIPEPTVSWYKDNRPLNETSDHLIKKSGNNYTLIIEKVKIQDAGKYMVRATNAGGEAQSIADFAVIEPTPERMVEVIKTIVYDNVKDQQELGKTSSKIPKTFHSSHIQSSTSTTDHAQPLPSQSHGTTEQTIITETKRTTEATMRMEHKTNACFDLPITLSQKTQTTIVPVISEGTMYDIPVQISSATNTERELTKSETTQTTPLPPPKPIKHIDVDEQQSTIETQSITKQMAYDYFINKLKPESEPDQSKYAPFIESDKMHVTKIGTPMVHSKIADFEKTIDEIKPINYPASDTLNHEPILRPGTPPDFGYIAENDELTESKKEIKHERISDRIKKLEESHKTLTEIPSGGVRMFPPPPPSTTPTAADHQELSKPRVMHKEMIHETKEYSHTKTFEPMYRRPASPLQVDNKMDGRSLSPRPSAEALVMEKLWTPKPIHESEINEMPKSLGLPPPRPISESVGHLNRTNQTFHSEILKEEKTLRKFSSFSESDVELQYENENESIERRPTTKEAAKLFEEKIKEVEQSIQQDTDNRASNLVKQTLTKPMVPKPIPHSPLDDIHLEPGSPPEMCYAPRPAYERKKSLVETIEETLEKDLEKEPSHVLPGSVRIMPPQIVKKDQQDQSITTNVQPPKYTPISQKQQIDLEEFPYATPKAEYPTKLVKPPPPPTPSKFVKSEYTESEYESDYRKLYESDTEDRRYRPIQAPSTTPTFKSFNPVESPCQFEIPVTMQSQNIKSFVPQQQQYEQPQQQHDIQKPKPIKFKPITSGYMADTEESVYHKTTTMSTMSSEQKYESHHSIQQENQNQNQNKQFFESQTNHVHNVYPPTQSFNPPVKHYRHHIHKHDTKDESSGNYTKDYSTTAMAKNISINSKYTKIREEPVLEPLPFVPEPTTRVKQTKLPPPPSPSKFIKGEFRESDYESDYESRIQPVWKPYDSDSEPIYYKSIRPPMTSTPTGRHSQISDGIGGGGKSPTPPTEFDRPPQFEGPPRPKFEPIDKFQTSKVAHNTSKFEQQIQYDSRQQQHVFKPKPVAAKIHQHINPQEQQQHYQKPMPQPQQQQQPTKYYTGIAGTPRHNATIAAETSNTMHMRESTENSHRVVNMTQTKRIIQFDSSSSTQQTASTQQQLEPFPYSVTEPTTDSEQYQQQQQYYSLRRQRLPPPPTPTKFVPVEFRESDYESEVDSARIRPLWTPNQSMDADNLQYRRVAAPTPTRSQSVPRSYGGSGRVLTPMEFDTKPAEMPSRIVIDTKQQQMHRQQASTVPTTMNAQNLQSSTHYRDNTKTQTLNRFTNKKQHNIMQQHSYNTNIQDLQRSSPPQYGYMPGKIIDSASNQMQSINTQFKTKASQFMQDVVGDAAAQHKKNVNVGKPILKKTTSDGGSGQDGAHAYREESRVSQYGTKHIDPDTGLIYFKYDFGYEFGIIFPGEGKKIIGSIGKDSRNTSSLNSTTTAANRKSFPLGVGNINIPVVHEKSGHVTNTTGGIQQSATSDSEYSEIELDPKRKRYSLPLQINIDGLHNDSTNNTNNNSKYQSDNLWSNNSTTNVQQFPVRARSTTPSNYGTLNDNHPKRPPIFITPLKDIAVVAGQTARFECIAQCDPHPDIAWSKNGHILENNYKFIIEFRNGVCRLTIPEAYPDDAGTYTCIATNVLGSVFTQAELLVPGDHWGVRK